MPHSSGGFHSHTIGKTLLFLSALKSQPQEFPLEKQTPSPLPQKQNKTPKKTTLGQGFWPGMDIKGTRELFEAPSNRASPGSRELWGSVGPGQGGLMRAARPSRALAAGGEGIPRRPQDPGPTPGKECHPSLGGPPLARGGCERGVHWQEFSGVLKCNSPRTERSPARAHAGGLGRGRRRRVEERRPCAHKGPPGPRPPRP